VIVAPQEIDLSCKDELYRLVESKWWPGSNLEIDLTKTTFIDSTGINWLLRVREQVTAEGRVMAVVIPSDGIVDMVLRTAECDRLLPLYRIATRLSAPSEQSNPHPSEVLSNP
jgi:anti-anti-sigma factor